MSRKQTNPRLDRLWEYDRGMLRSAFVSLFWAVIKARSLTLQWVAEKLGIDKSAVSRWFSGQHPNWTSDTIADLAHALDLEIEITARDRTTGIIYAPHGATNIITPQTRGGDDNILSNFRNG